MYTLKGFISYPEMIDNTVGVVSKLGEISKDSLTYAKETGIYKHAGFPGTLLYSFFSTHDNTTQVKVPDTFRDLSIRVGDFVKTAAFDTRFTESRTAALHELEVELGSAVINLNIGLMVEENGIWMPEWVSFNVTDTDTFIKLWFADESFSLQYDNFEYEFIAPLEDIDDFFRLRAQVVGLIDSITLKETMERVAVVRDVNPYTILKSETYNWVDPNDNTFEYPTEWTVMIYGRAGNDLDQIRLALIDRIMANTTYTREEWVEIFPDIFIPTEFIISPMWHKYAIPNQTIQAGMYSPVVGVNEAVSVATNFCLGLGYESEHLTFNTQVLPVAYKTTALLVTGNNLNRDGITEIAGHFPDYTDIPLTHPDFARMTPKTQEWIRLVTTALVYSETLGIYSPVPEGYSRIVRDGVIYLAREYHGVQYMVVTKTSSHEVFNIT